jgi:hypothetical protein
MAVKHSRLTVKQLKAVSLLAEGLPHSAIASQLGIGLRTIQRWATLPDVRQAMAEAQARLASELGEEIFYKCKTALTKGLPKAIRRTIESLDHSDARIQIRAAEAIARWSGFYQPNRPNVEPQGNPEQNLKGYLAYLETTTPNGNGSQHQSIR